MAPRVPPRPRMIELRMLGRLSLTAADGREVRTLLGQPRRFALLAYLAAATPPGLQRQQAVAAVEARRGRSGKVREKGEAPGLAEERVHLPPVGSGEAQSPEHTELDHARPRWRRRRRPEVHAPLGAP